ETDLAQGPLRSPANGHSTSSPAGSRRWRGNLSALGRGCRRRNTYLGAVNEARYRRAADSIAPGVNSSSDPTTSAASASASRSGGYSRLGLAITTIPAAAAARRPFVESSTAAASAGATPSRRAAARYTS